LGGFWHLLWARQVLRPFIPYSLRRYFKKEIFMELKESANKTALDVLAFLHATDAGLTASEAEVRRQQYGSNTFKKTRNNFIKILLRQFNNAIIYLLLVATILAFATGDKTDGYVIGFVLLANALLGFIQEYRSERAAEKLTALVKNHVLVKRDGNEITIAQDHLVPGDIIILKEGDIVPADCKIIASDDFSVNESQLTGESKAVLKQAVEGQDAHQTIVYAGSIIEAGEGTLVVYAIGETTELGRIAHLSTSTHRVTQYEKSLQSFSTLLIKLSIIFIPLIFFVKIVLLHNYTGLTENLIFMFAFAIAVVPEALPVVVTVALASGAMHLAKRSVIVKKLSAIEDIGNVTVLCTDKTGTLTENKLTINGVVSDQSEWLQLLAHACLDFVDEKRKKYASSYDVAFENYIGHDLEVRARQLHKVKELPFSTEARRRRIVLEDATDNKRYLVEIGSAETLLTISKHERREKYLDQIVEDGTKGIRHLGVAVKEIGGRKDFDILKHESGLEFLGFVQLVDPLKPTAKATIRKARELGVTVKILTGDSKEVAAYVAEQVGLIAPGDRVYTGDEFDKLTPTEMKKAIKGAVFARVSPEQKYKLIELLKETEVVAYQGDGINDAPSLKLADVAIAVNTATDVAKESADILLLKSDMSIVIQAISGGRATFANINKYIRYTMIGNFSSFFTLAALYLTGKDLPLLPIQLLIVSSFTQLPLAAISSDRVDDKELRNPSHYNIRSLMFISLFLGIATTLCQLLFFVIVRHQSTNLAQTSLFFYLMLVQLIVIFSVRNTDYFWRGRKPSTKFLGAMGSTFIATIVMLYVSPFKNWLSVTSLPLGWFSVSIIATFAYLVLIDFLKVQYYRIPGELQSKA
jgi:Mg2+-importing ATPase